MLTTSTFFSVILIPIIFIALEFLVEMVKSRPSRVIIKDNNNEGVKVKKFDIETNSIIGINELLTVEQLKEFIRRDNGQIKDITELQPGIRRWNYGTQMTIAGIAIHADTMIGLWSIRNSVSETTYNVGFAFVLLYLLGILLIILLDRELEKNIHRVRDYILYEKLERIAIYAILPNVIGFGSMLMALGYIIWAGF